KVPVGSTGSIAVAESDPKIIWLGTGSPAIRSNVSTGRGVYKSSNGGDSWQFVGLYDAGQIGAVRIHPTNPNIVWVAAVGDAFKPNHERGIFKTVDGGATWKNTLFISDSTGAADVELDPANPNIVYAWMWRAERKPWTIISGAHEGGFYKSTDGGDTWRKITNGLPTDLVGRGNIAVTAANPNRVYALVEALPGGGLYRSEDAGESWKLINTNPQLITRPFYYTALAADPTNANVVYGGAENFYKSTDGGATVQTMRTPHGDNHDMWISPKDGNTMIEANDGGANVSFDGGRTWSTQDNQPTAEIYGVWLDNQYPYRMYGAQQDANTVIVPSEPLGNGAPEYRGGPGCETGPIMPHPTNPDTVYGSCKGQYEWMDMRTGTVRQYWIGGQSLYGNDAKDLIDRFQRVSPMATSPNDPRVLYYGGQYLFRTRDLGVTWEKISPDLTAHPACCQGGSGEPITRDVTGEEFYSTLYAIAEAPGEPGVIWTGSNDGPFYLTRDDGKSWTNVTPKDLPPGGRVQYIEPSPHRKGSAYYAVYRYLLGDYQPYIYETRDYGATWKRLTDGKNGIPADWPTRVVREDPSREGLLFAGTEFGMFVSYDDGKQWQPFQLNLPNVPVTDIKIYQKDMVVSTQGRSLWILDDIAPVEQIAQGTAAASATLFKPRDAYRVQVAGGRGRGGGGGGGGGGRGGRGAGAGVADEGPAAPQYPPGGAMIDYYLASVPAGPVRIDISDSAGKEVAAFASDGSARIAATAVDVGPLGGGGDEPAAGPPAGGGRGRGGGGGAPPPRPTAAAGMNRFYWDFMNQVNGMLLPPALYHVKLTVGTYTGTQTLRLLVDPRSAADGVTAADVREQYAFNVKMTDFVAEAQGVNTRVTQARNRLWGKTGAAGDTLAKVNAVFDKLSDQRTADDVVVRYGRPGFMTQVRYLAGMTRGPDERIGRDAITRYGQLRKQLDAIEAEANKALGSEKK
ncbi:MAG TPA: hypothetical protein VMH39_07435, partial [Gemmatimonadaceae bacterium]|nr:hypothetical protein [Gemmatimonadaceae bacterium]